MKYTYILISFLLSLTLQAKDKELVIDMTQAKVGDIPLSRIVSKLEYIPLELTKESLLKKPSVFLTDRYIITSEFAGKICLFDRKSGKYNFSRPCQGLRKNWQAQLEGGAAGQAISPVGCCLARGSQSSGMSIVGDCRFDSGAGFELFTQIPISFF